MQDKDGHFPEGGIRPGALDHHRDVESSVDMSLAVARSTILLSGQHRRLHCNTVGILSLCLSTGVVDRS